MVLFHLDGTTARRTVSRLSRAGFDGDAMRFLAPSEVTTAGRYADRQVDRGITQTLAKRALTGGLIGALIGVVPGALLLAVFSQATVVVLASGAAAGAVFGWGIGVLLAFQTVPTMAPLWERTFAPLLPGGVAVLVTISTERQYRRLMRIVARSELVAVLSYEEYRDETA
ncbi:MAG: hypothetical protein WD360_08130 [Nitriliruptoraceae bacterium]